MSTLFQILMLVSTLQMPGRDSITIRNIGISDKPIPTIVIYDINRKSADVYHYSLDWKTYRKIESIINNFSGYSSKSDGYYGTFDLTILKKGKSSRLIINKDNARVLFNQIRQYLTTHPKNNDLNLGLESVLKRITFKNEK